MRPRWVLIRPKLLNQMKLGRSVVWMGTTIPRVTAAMATDSSLHFMRVIA